MSSQNAETAVAPRIDVEQEQLARIYAKAFLGAAKQAGDVAGAVEELASLVTEVLDQFPKFDEALTSDFLSPEEQLELLDAVLQGRASDVVLHLLKVLAEHRRLSALRAVIRMVAKLYGESQGRHQVRVTVPGAISTDLEQELRQALEKSLHVEPDLTFASDPELIGGMVIQVGDKVYDGSVRTSLERMRQQMIDRAIEAIETTPHKFVREG